MALVSEAPELVGKSVGVKVASELQLHFST